jgi:hypothetical protein
MSGLLPTALRFPRPYKLLVRLLKCVTTKCPEPLRPRVGVTSSRHRIRTRVGRHYPAFVAPTSSCAGPRPSWCLGINLAHQVFAGCRQPLLGIAPSRRYLCESFPTCLDPYPGCSCGALTRFFPQDNGLPNTMTRSARSLSRPWHIIRTAISVRSIFTRLQSFTHVQARGFARHPDCSYRSES